MEASGNVATGDQKKQTDSEEIRRQQNSRSQRQAAQGRGRGWREQGNGERRGQGKSKGEQREDKGSRHRKNTERPQDTKEKHNLSHQTGKKSDNSFPQGAEGQSFESSGKQVTAQDIGDLLSVIDNINAKGGKQNVVKPASQSRFERRGSGSVPRGRDKRPDRSGAGEDDWKRRPHSGKDYRKGKNSSRGYEDSTPENSLYYYMPKQRKKQDKDEKGKEGNLVYKNESTVEEFPVELQDVRYERSQQNQIGLGARGGFRNGFDRKSRPGGGESRQSWRRGDDLAVGGIQQRAPDKRRDKMKKLDPESQTASLIEQLQTNSYECMVCCDVIRREAPLWSCKSCFHMFHLRCIKKWARSPAASLEGQDNGWRCPACQNVTRKVPNAYKCFCEKVWEPEYVRNDTPHSCGDVCGKKKDQDCPHLCTMLCHPGPCPPCPVMVTKSCHCGKTKQSVRCSQGTTIKCGTPCGKKLNCSVHTCEDICHAGDCQPCAVILTQACYCGRVVREVVCGGEEWTGEDVDGDGSSFSCKNVCDRELECGHHTCEELCHSAPCPPCPKLPSQVKFCCCGQTTVDKLEELGENGSRKTCLDPLPTCRKTCNKPIGCGSDESDEIHLCQKTCHAGKCGPCEGTTKLTCRCGWKTQELPCKDVKGRSVEDEFLCDKRCNKKRKCGRHKCGQPCCVELDHTCPFVCGRKLSCGLHRCEQPCHRGNCEPCWQTSFEELYCHCGASVLFPPVPCGTPPPECHRMCSRQHSCEHQVQHTCHSDDKCPPCTFLVQRKCMGQHELRNNVPCHITDISCGRPCNRLLPCGVHQCLRICHKDECVREDELCEQRCSKPRQECGHPCGAPCHQGTLCPRTPCRAKVTVRCKCGLRSEKVQCSETQLEHAFQRLTTSTLATRWGDMQAGQSVDISALVKMGKDGKKILELDCTEECAVYERNKRLAMALQIENPDTSSKLGPPPYTEFLKEQASKNKSLVSSVEDALTKLVQTAKESKQKSRSHAFPPMKREDRRVIHELSEFYGIEVMSYDVEPKRNCVATAYRDRCWLPAASLVSVVERESNPKPPPPIPHHITDKGAIGKSSQHTVIPAKNAWRGPSKEPDVEVIDYFDMD
ncbi:LOW QUALITY PROTEIN: transcriptional repressor NF-X1-like [Branchiostoma floridae]|uniref:LOW QUALITY PROTEIN: transcriptional repressor NF-X1-like n=1 Tax=Branchiostoma floridae TaxID=7739 RepID=A0A9J7LW14_BRAFL|nr:LOW QUALITY PROTEIN: transcriptional repressor NF-X1-like [Branchiostoma floridae]